MLSSSSCEILISEKRNIAYLLTHYLPTPDNNWRINKIQKFEKWLSSAEIALVHRISFNINAIIIVFYFNFVSSFLKYYYTSGALLFKRTTNVGIGKGFRIKMWTTKMFTLYCSVCNELVNLFLFISTII